MDNTKILDLIKKLLSHKESAEAIGSLEEAEAFGRRIQALCDKYRVSLGHLTEEELRETVSRGEWRNNRNARRRSSWVRLMSDGIAHGHNCRALTYVGLDDCAFVGLEADVQVCVAMMTILSRAMFACFEQEKVIRKVHRAKPPVWKEYSLGFARAIAWGYVQRVRAAKAEAEAAGAAGDASQALVKVTERLIDDYLKGRNVKPGRAFKIDSDHRDYVAGFRDGSSQNLDARLLSDGGGARTPHQLTGGTE